MRLLQRKFEVETRYGGGFVQEIDGVGGGRRSGRPVDWFFYVNGIEAEHRRRRARGSRPATACGGTTTTGAPRCASPPSSAPSRRRSCRGSKGKRVPVRIDCGAGAAARVPRGAEAARGRGREGRRDVGDRPAGERGVLRVLVGRWSEVRRDPAARRIERGPKVSGVFARPSATGDRIELLDARGAAAAHARGGRRPRGRDELPRPAADLGRGGDRRRRRRRRGGRAERDAAARPLRASRSRRAASCRCRCRCRRRDGGPVTYRRRASPLHAARAGVGSLFCVVLAGVALSFEHPLLLGAVLLAVLLAAAGAGVGDVVARSLLWGLPFALLIALINALVVREGLTVICALRRAAAVRRGRRHARGDDLRRDPRPARADRHRLLRAALRRDRSRRAAARVPPPLLPLGADGRARHADGAGAGARRAALPRRPALPPGRARARGTAILRAVTTGALDRAVDVAATLEVRGYGGDAAAAAPGAAVVAPRPRLRRSRPARSPRWGSRRRCCGWEPFEAYPRTLAPVDAGVLALAAALVACALLPFADRRGIGR